MSVVGLWFGSVPDCWVSQPSTRINSRVQSTQQRSSSSLLLAKFDRDTAYKHESEPQLKTEISTIADKRLRPKALSTRSPISSSQPPPPHLHISLDTLSSHPHSAATTTTAALNHHLQTESLNPSPHKPRSTTQKCAMLKRSALHPATTSGCVFASPATPQSPTPHPSALQPRVLNLALTPVPSSAAKFLCARGARLRHYGREGMPASSVTGMASTMRIK